MDENLRPIKKSEIKRMFPQLASPVDRIDIYLIFDDLDFDPDIITEKTKLEPYNIYKKGIIYKKRSGKEWESKSNCWEIKYSQLNAVYSEDAINGFMEQIINPHIEYFKEIVKNANGILEFVYYYYYSNNIGIGFEKAFVKVLSELNLRVSFDIYCLHEEVN